MNMKYSLVFIIVLGLLCGCVRQRKADASDTGSIEMTQSETDALTADSVPLGVINKLLIKVFNN